MSSQTSPFTESKAPIANPQNGSWMNKVKQYVEDMRFGSVSITVHEGRVVQIEVSTKVRFEKVH